MANKTRIEWADLTINPIIGCTKCSPGCDHCYAERMAARLAKNPNTSKRYSSVITNGKWNGFTDINIHDCFNGLPVKQKRVFVGSMGDVFHKSITERKICRLFEYMQDFSQHIFILLTKRPERMKYLMNLENDIRKNDSEEEQENRTFPIWPLPNVWLGVTVCNRRELIKIDALRNTPASKRFVSIEPLLGELGAIDLSGIDWVILGGETGPKARPMHPDWVRSVRDQCQSAGVPFFFKQWGEWAPHCLCHRKNPCVTRRCPEPGCRWDMFRCGNKYSGCLLDGREWKEFPA